MALNRSIQQEREIHNFSTFSKTHYGQFITHPKDTRNYNSHIGMTQEAMKNFDPSDTMIHMHTIQVINENTHD